VVSLDRWKLVFWTAFFVVILFIWGNEVFDFPHTLLRAPKTPVNWQESIIETVFAALFAAMSYFFVNRYQKRWLSTLDELRTLAALDPLTGILNRREFYERASAEFSRSVRSGVPFTLILIDVDNFKEVNDRYGHPCGDRVLIALVDTIKWNIRPHDLVSRLGGDEFGVLLVDANGDSTNLLQRRILDEWNKAGTLSDDGQQITASISMGVTSWDAANASFEDVVRRADKLLYQAKDTGRNRIVAG
jgi:diguanylate cyclase (GGDEF)-like protein